MKKYLLPLSVAAFFGALQPLMAQQPHAGCGTPHPKQVLQFAATENLSANPYVVQIFVHILRNDDGSNAAMDDATLRTNLDRMAAFYRPHNICFTFVGRDFIDNTEWNTNYATADIGDLHAVNPHSDAIDIYVHANGFEGSGGNAYDIPSSKCSVAATASFNFEHEVGHCLGLLHTFEDFMGAECPDGSGCGSDGDFVCDTPADFAGSQNMSSGCTYTGSQTINCNGSTQTYNPPTNNIMSYWAGCYAQFSAGQGSRMRNTIDATGFLQDRLTPDDRIISNTTLNGEIAVGAQNSIQMGNIAAAGDVAINGNAHGMFNAGQFIQLVPGTGITPSGSNSVLLTINRMCDGLFLTSEFPTADRTRAGANASAGMQVSPNPFSSTVEVALTLPAPGPATLILLDVSGKMIQEIPLQGNESAQTLQLNLPQLNSGLYFLRLRHTRGSETARLVKM
ncbi:MAG TPA: zinc-dependent metalloprotease [Saprospiraceae bacterium]|nr:zinc-dependent metalloprotease [Saprospiraceae bacterium]